jgi:predicted deacylase
MVHKLKKKSCTYYTKCIHLLYDIGTLRSAAAARGIKAITVEIGNPQTFQDRYIQVIS